MEPVFNAIVALEKESTQLNWRVNLKLIQSFAKLPDYFDSDAVYEQTALMLLRKLLEVTRQLVYSNLIESSASVKA